MAINPAIGLVGVAFQPDRDTAATAPTFKHGLTGGSPFSADRSIASTSVACGNRAPTDARVDSIEVGGSIESLCYPDTVGFYIYAGLGAEEVGQDGVPEGYYKHVFTMGDKLPYCTIWSQVGVDNFTQAIGCKASSVEFSATGNEPIAMTAQFIGIDGKVGIDGIPGDVAASCYGGKFIPTDCEFKLDTASDNPAEALVSDVSFTITNGTSGLTSLGRATARDIADGQLSFGVSATTIPDDITEYKKMVTGSADSVDISGKVVMGSVYAKFYHSEDPNITLEFEVHHVPFTAEYPSVDPEGTEGTIQFTCDAAIIAAAGESPATITLVNKVASYGPTVTSISVSGTSNIPVEGAVTLSATGTYSDNSVKQLTGVSYSSSDPSTVAVSGNTATWKKPGNAKISATYKGVTGTMNVSCASDTTKNSAGRYDHLDALERRSRDGKIFTVSVPKFTADGTGACTALDDLKGLKATPSTNATAGNDPFKSLHMFKSETVNGGVDDDGTNYVTARGSEVKLDGTNGNVWQYVPCIYEKHTETADAYVHSYTDTPRSGYAPMDLFKMPDGEVRPYALIAKYQASMVNGKMASVSGKQPASYISGKDEGADMSLPGQINAAKAVGAGYGGSSYKAMAYLQAMFLLKYQVKDSQSVLAGCSNFSGQYTVAAAETGQSRVLLSQTQAQYFPVGSRVSVGVPHVFTASDEPAAETPVLMSDAPQPLALAAENTSLDRQYKELHSLAYYAKVTGTVKVGDNYALTLDCPKFNSTADAVVTPMPWYTGACDAVRGLDGSPSDPLSGKEPFVLQGVELMSGQMEVLGDAMCVNADGETDVLIAKNSVGLTASPSNPKFSVAGTLPGGYDGKYVRDMAWSNGMFIPSAFGDSPEAAGFKDVVFGDPQTSGNRQFLAFGTLLYGSGAGFASARLGDGAGWRRWRLGGRLSASAVGA